MGELDVSLAPGHAAFEGVTAPLVPLHVAPDAEGLAAAGVGALERLLARVAVAVNAQGAGSGKGLVARRADVPVLALGEAGSRRRGNVVVVLPKAVVVGAATAHGLRELGRRKHLRERTLEVEAGDLR